MTLIHFRVFIVYVHNYRGQLSPSAMWVLVIVGRSGAGSLLGQHSYSPKVIFFSLISFLFYYLMYVIVLAACMTVLHVSLVP